MKRNLFFTTMLFTLSLFYAVSSKAQDTTTIDTAWKTGGFTSITLSQVAFRDWAGGGENSISVTGIVSVFANYKKGLHSWENSMDLGYGILKPGNQDFRKNEDKIDITSKHGYFLKDKLLLSTLFNLKTQFSPGYNYPNDSTVVSRFNAPTYIILAVGLDYKPNDYFSLFISPATGKLTIVSDQAIADSGSFGVEGATFDTLGNKLTSGKNIRYEFGAYLNAKFQKDISKNVNLLSKLSLFNNYVDKNVSNRKNIDVAWETMVSIKAGKYLTTSIFVHLIYDNDIDIPTYETINGVETVVGEGPKLQLKEVFGLGLSYKF